MIYIFFVSVFLWAEYVNTIFSSESRSVIGKGAPENRGDSFISFLEKPLVWYLIDKAELFPKRVVFLFYHGSQEDGSLSPFMCEPCFLLSLPLSLCKNEQLYIATGQVLRDRRSKEPVSGGEWVSGRNGRREGGCCEIWNRCCTNRMGATAFQFGQISCAIFLNITKTNYPGPWCMFLLLWKTIKLCKWLMPFHTAIFSLWISKVFFFPPSLCLKQRQLCSKNLLDAFPVNPLSMFLYKHVFERRRKKADKQANSQWKLGLSCGAWLVIITMPWICRPTGKHNLAHGAKKKKDGAIKYTAVTVCVVMGSFVLCLRCNVSSPWSLITIYLFSYDCSFISVHLFYS